LAAVCRLVTVGLAVAASRAAPRARRRARPN